MQRNAGPATSPLDGAQSTSSLPLRDLSLPVNGKVESFASSSVSSLTGDTGAYFLTFPVSGRFSSESGVTEEPVSQQRLNVDSVELGIDIAEPAGIRAQPGELILQPILPENLKRYEHRIRFKGRGSHWNVEAMLTAANFERNKYKDWSSFTHPEGMLYHKTLEDEVTFTTDIDIYHEDCDDKEVEYLNERVREAINRLEAELFHFEQKCHDIPERKHLEIVFDTVDYNTFEYYIADHANQHILWSDDFLIDTIVHGGSHSMPHLRTYLTYQYYMHLSSFPHTNELPPGFFAELNGILTWSLTDALTSLESLAGYNESEMDKFLALSKIMEHNEGKAPAYVVASAARLRSRFELERYHHFYGHSYARLSLGESVHEEKESSISSFGYFLSFLLFHVPMKRLEMVNKTYVDHMVQRIAFAGFTERLIDSWQTEIINATVLLNANVAYLALPGILQATNSGDPNPSNSNSLSIGQVASFISMAASLSSAILGLLLTKRMRGLQEKEPNEIAEYLHHWWSEKHRMLKLALMYSLPYGLLMWGALSFVVAIFYVAYLHIHFDPKSIMLSLVLCFVAIACIWTILQISSWTSFAYGISRTVRRWVKPSDTREEDRSQVAKQIIYVRRTVKRKATLLAKPVLYKAASLPLPSFPKAIRKATGQLRRKGTIEPRAYANV